MKICIISIITALSLSSFGAHAKNYVVGCSILDDQRRPIKAVAGRACLFFEDGSWVAASDTATGYFLEIKEFDLSSDLENTKI